MPLGPTAPPDFRIGCARRGASWRGEVAEPILVALCKWATVDALARHRLKGNKIELFYFLPIFWLNRAFIATRRAESLAEIKAWWGRPDWRQLIDMPNHEKALAFQKRLRELGYKHVWPFPIVDSENGNRIMFYMILATDHPDAPKLMWRAYDQALPEELGWVQRELEGL